MRLCIMCRTTPTSFFMERFCAVASTVDVYTYEEVPSVSQGTYDIVVCDASYEETPVHEHIPIHYLRELGILMPILLVTHPKVSSAYRTVMFNAGVDACVSADISVCELGVICTHLTRRETRPRFFGEVIQVGSVVLNIHTHEVTHRSRVVSLTKIEYMIIEYLFMHRRSVVSQDELIACVLDESIGSSDVLYTHIYNIRKKLHPDDIIRTISRHGFMVSGDTAP